MLLHDQRDKTRTILPQNIHFTTSVTGTFTEGTPVVELVPVTVMVYVPDGVTTGGGGGGGGVPPPPPQPMKISMKANTQMLVASHRTLRFPRRYAPIPHNASAATKHPR